MQEELEKNLKDELSLKIFVFETFFGIGKFAWLAKTVLCFKMNILHAVITYMFEQAYGSLIWLADVKLRVMIYNL